MIRNVAIYLRKSRQTLGETEYDNLNKQKKLLVDMAETNNWRYTIYKEVAGSNSIEFRAEFKRMLNHVKENLYDAILVTDIDRISRGEWEDIISIRKILKQTSTKIITPAKVYDLTSDQQQVFHDIEQVLARYEYMTIRKRLQEGKKAGARMGKWVNGTPPFPYRYNTKTRELEVDETNRETYALIKKMILSGNSCYKVAKDLNERGIPSKRGGKWRGETIRGIITSEVHLGKVLFGKTSGSGHTDKKRQPLKNNDRDSWIIAEGKHPILKTPTEHAQILSILERKPITNKPPSHPLTGLIYCGLCNKKMAVVRKKKDFSSESMCIY